MVWWPLITTYTFLDLRVTMCSTICCCRSLPHTQFIDFKTSLVLDEFITCATYLLYSFSSLALFLLCKRVFYLLLMSQLLKLYISTSCSHHSVHLPITYYMYTRALLSSALFLSLALHHFISICIHICTGKYSVCIAMRCPVYFSSRLLFPLLIR